MKIIANSHSIFELTSQVMVVPFDVKQGLKGFLSDLNQKTENYFSHIPNNLLPQKNGQISEFHQVPNLSAGLVLLVGVGDSKMQFVEAMRSVAQKIREKNLTNVSTSVALSEFSFANTNELVALFAQTLIESDYICDDYKSKKSERKSVEVFVTSDDASISLSIDKGVAIAKGMNTLKHLGNAPGNVCTPTYLANYAEKLSCDLGNISTTVFDEQALEDMKMGSLLSVSKGSIEPPKLIKMEYNGANNQDAPIVLVGKGVTFDTGGISLKPSANMDEMKYDMCGAGSVVGALHTIALLKLPINVVGIIPTVENMPSDRATKPGDIVTSMSGKTIEILNTDAEGRLILCDAITYAKQLKPKAIVDIATLTGAVIIALGRAASGVMSNDDELAKQLEAAGNTSLDRVWRLPVWDDYTQLLDSPFADLQNIGGREAGTITAGCFLGEFAKDVPWAHIDIAGTAWANRKSGATGRPVPLLVEYITSQIKK